MCKSRDIVLYAKFHLCKEFPRPQHLHWWYHNFIMMNVIGRPLHLHMQFSTLDVNAWTKKIDTIVLMWIPLLILEISLASTYKNQRSPFPCVEFQLWNMNPVHCEATSYPSTPNFMRWLYLKIHVLLIRKKCNVYF
jgi:hypothetical protein